MALDCRILLEDGSVLLQEDGTSDFLLENCAPSIGTDTGCDLLLEDGGLLLQEDGASAFLLENCGGVPVHPGHGGWRHIQPVPLDFEDDEAVAAVLAVWSRLRRRKVTVG